MEQFGYAFTDVVKLEGHACPTTACAFECCRAALDRLYPGETPVRGEIEVTVYGAPDDGVYGVFGHVLGFITGAAPETGFKGLGALYRRKDLLRYDEASPDPNAMCFRFRRKDIMEEEHVEFRAKKKELFHVVGKRDELEFDAFKAKVKELGTFISRELESHIFKEDNILYQIALQVLTRDEWAEVKRKADKIGYCCFRPQDQ